MWLGDDFCPNFHFVGNKVHKNLENEIKNIQHADDMTLAVRDTDSLTHAVKTINELL